MKILFIYPNVDAGLRIPLAIAILQAALKEKGHQVQIFDTTFMSDTYGRDYKSMESRGVVKTTSLEETVGKIEKKDIKSELRLIIDEFSPDIIMFSLLERNYLPFKQLASMAKSAFPHIPVLVGGILPSLMPDLVLAEPFVDWVCVGEGEIAVCEAVESYERQHRVVGVSNIWCKENGKVIKSLPGPLIDIETIPEQDWSGFDTRHLFKPFEGNVYVGGSFEWSRGCYNNCAFCVGPALRKVYDAKGKEYHRTKSVRKIIDEIVNKKKMYNLTLNAFCDTNFLQGISEELLYSFCKAYANEVSLPFIIQTSAESINESKLQMLIEAGCVTASIGVESGSEHIRRSIINKGPARKRIKACFDLCRRYNFRLTANYMIGLPFETEEDVMETMRFNRELNPPSIAIHYFTPFLGTRLYDVSKAEGFYEGFNPKASVYKDSPLTMPQLSHDRISQLVKDFVDDFNSWKQEIKIEI